MWKYLLCAFILGDFVGAGTMLLLLLRKVGKD